MSELGLALSCFLEATLSCLLSKMLPPAFLSPCTGSPQNFQDEPGIPLGPSLIQAPESGEMDSNPSSGTDQKCDLSCSTFLCFSPLIYKMGAVRTE